MDGRPSLGEGKGGKINCLWTPSTSQTNFRLGGLSHLHNAKPPVFHRDIKSQNILLDRAGNAKAGRGARQRERQPFRKKCKAYQYNLKGVHGPRAHVFKPVG